MKLVYSVEERSPHNCGVKKGKEETHERSVPTCELSLYEMELGHPRYSHDHQQYPNRRRECGFWRGARRNGNVTCGLIETKGVILILVTPLVAEPLEGFLDGGHSGVSDDK